MTLQLIHSEFPYLWGKFDFLFCRCTVLEMVFSYGWKETLLQDFSKK
jgi:hypothetical protein